MPQPAREEASLITPQRSRERLADVGSGWFQITPEIPGGHNIPRSGGRRTGTIWRNINPLITPCKPLRTPHSKSKFLVIIGDKVGNFCRSVGFNLNS